MSRIVSGAFLLFVLLTSLLAFAFNVGADEQVGAIYIRADGSVDPPTELIQRDGDLYTLTGNITHNDLASAGIVIQRNDVVLDGAGCMLQGAYVGEINTNENRGVFVSPQTDNVTIKNLRIKGWSTGIGIIDSSNDSVVENDIDEVLWGITLNGSRNNCIFGNNLTYKDWKYGWFGVDGVYLKNSPDNTISGNNVSTFVHGIKLSNSSGSCISQNIVTREYMDGIAVASSSYVNVIENNVTNNDAGICIFSCHNNIVSGNSITDNNYGICGGNDYISGVDLSYYLISEGGNPGPTRCSVFGNRIENNDYGINLDFAMNWTITGNCIKRNDENILTVSYYINIFANTFVESGLVIQGSYENAVEGNTVNDKPLVYLEGVSDYSVSDAGQVILIDCDNVRVENLNLSCASLGVELWRTNNSKVVCNNIMGDDMAIYSYGSSNNSITENNMSTNGIILYNSDYNKVVGNNIRGANQFGQIAILLHGSDHNSIVGNNLVENFCAIYVDSSPNNSVYHNNFINNEIQTAFDYPGSRDTWDSGYPSGGNYWSDYVGNDSDGDGIGDKSYSMVYRNQDSYPLMTPWTPHDIAVVQASSTGAPVNQGAVVNMSVVLANRGIETEVFNLTVYVNLTAVASQTVMLTSEGSATIILTWNTTGFLKGNYIITAVAGPVSNETHTEDNTKTGGTITVRIRGDANIDGKVDVKDLYAIAKTYGSSSGDPRYYPSFDLNEDGTIDARDYYVVCKNYGTAPP